MAEHPKRVSSNLLHCAGEWCLQAMVQSSEHESSYLLITWLYDLTLCALLFFLPCHFALQFSCIPFCYFLYLSWLLLSLSHWNSLAELQALHSWEKHYPESCPTCELERNIYNKRYTRTPLSKIKSLSGIKMKLTQVLQYHSTMT